MGKGGNPFDDATGFTEGEEPEDSSAAENGEETQPEDAQQSRPAPSTTGAADQTHEEETVERRQQPLPVEKSEPGFPFSDCDQVQLYLRNETDNRLDDLKHDVEGHLRRAYGVRNAENREVDDAIVTALIEQLSPEQIASIVIENRGYSP